MYAENVFFLFPPCCEMKKLAGWPDDAGYRGEKMIFGSVCTTRMVFDLAPKKHPVNVIHKD